MSKPFAQKPPPVPRSKSLRSKKWTQTKSSNRLFSHHFPHHPATSRNVQTFCSRTDGEEGDGECELRPNAIVDPMPRLGMFNETMHAHRGPRVSRDQMEKLEHFTPLRNADLLADIGNASLEHSRCGSGRDPPHPWKNGSRLGLNPAPRWRSGDLPRGLGEGGEVLGTGAFESGCERGASIRAGPSASAAPQGRGIAMPPCERAANAGSRFSVRARQKMRAVVS
ncbi:MAG: hypothetical protein KatS3mg125_1403 [Lysobacterales bacterium]|nr:MAG: hypothetical protein KatS3mg125_1403 [Xanthomonadales bacterium]